MEAEGKTGALLLVTVARQHWPLAMGGLTLTNQTLASYTVMVLTTALAVIVESAMKASLRASITLIVRKGRRAQAFTRPCGWRCT